MKFRSLQFLTDAEQGNVRDVTIQEQQITGHMTAGTTFQTYAPKDASYIELLQAKGVKIIAKPASENISLLGALISWFPMLLILGIWLFVMRQMQGSGGKAMGFGKSKAKLLTESAWPGDLRGCCRGRRGQGGS